MPYTVVHGKGVRPWKIKDKQTRRIVGTSVLKRDALASIAHREKAIADKKS